MKSYSRGKTNRTVRKTLTKLNSSKTQGRRVHPAQAHQSRIYSDYALLYDQIFGRIFSNRVKWVIESLRIPPGAKVLELGVGTGTSFPAYPRHCEVIGIDLASEMLVHARAKIVKNSWSHLRVLEMDALNLAFADNSFDYVMAFHTVTVVPDPIRMLVEARRVCRPKGKIVIVNHFTTDLPVIGPVTEALDPLTRRLGWRTKLKLQPFLQATRLSVEEIYKLSKMSLYTVVRSINQKGGQDNGLRS